MIELIKFFRVLFMSPKLSRERLKAFCEDHIQRLTANNPGGIFTGILTAVTAAYNSYYGDLSSYSVNLAVKEGTTLALKESRTALEKNISNNNGLVDYTYRNNRPAYEQFYPLGMDEYYQADTSTFETIALRYKTVLASHAADFPAPFVTEYNTLQGTFVTNLNANSTAKGKVSSESSDIATTRPALALQLTTNVLTIALQYVGDESKCDVYFDQSIIDAAFRESDRKVTGAINPAETQNVFDNIIKADLRLTIKNTGDSALNFAFMKADTDAVSDAVNKLDPGASINKTAAELGWTSDAKFLNVTNSGDMAGSYSVEKA